MIWDFLYGIDFDIEDIVLVMGGFDLFMFLVEFFFIGSWIILRSKVLLYIWNKW